MLIELSKIKNLPVGSFSESKLVGKVDMVVISPQDGRIIAIKVATGRFVKSYRIVSFQDIVDIDANGVTINNSENLLPVDEIVRVKDILEKKFNLIGLIARTKNKKYLGRVKDAVVETTSGDIIRLYVGGYFSQKVFTRSMIYQIKKNEIILTFDERVKQGSSSKLSAIGENSTELA